MYLSDRGSNVSFVKIANRVTPVTNTNNYWGSRWKRILKNCREQKFYITTTNANLVDLADYNILHSNINVEIK